MAKLLHFNPKKVDMRTLLRQECPACAHRWQAPARGACPKCHEEATVLYDVSYCAAAYTK